MKTDFDIMVVGAGMVGASAALHFAREGLRVAIVERQSLQASDYQIGDEHDNRVSAISPSSQHLLHQLGVWDEIKSRRSCDYHHMRVWHENGQAQMEFSCEQLAITRLGSIVENKLIQSVLLEQLNSNSNVTLFEKQSVIAMQQNADTVQLHTNADQVLQAQLVLAVDGRGSAVRKLLNMGSYGGSYNQIAIVANVETERPHQSTAWQRFLCTGPLAFLPLSNGQSSIVWSADTPRAQELMALSDEEFMQQLASAFEYRLGAITASSKRAAFPLNWHAASDWLKGRVLLLGDAAHGVHPLAGQGVNLGFDDVALLAKYVSSKGPLYSHKKLRQFERRRKAETVTATHLFSALKLIYAQKSPVLCSIRDRGMSLVQTNNLLKRLIMQTALQNMA